MNQKRTRRQLLGSNDRDGRRFSKRTTQLDQTRNRRCLRHGSNRDELLHGVGAFVHCVSRPKTYTASPVADDEYTLPPVVLVRRNAPRTESLIGCTSSSDNEQARSHSNVEYLADVREIPVKPLPECLDTYLHIHCHCAFTTALKAKTDNFSVPSRKRRPNNDSHSAGARKMLSTAQDRTPQPATAYKRRTRRKQP